MSHTQTHRGRESERERERERERQTDRETERERDRETEIEKHGPEVPVRDRGGGVTDEMTGRCWRNPQCIEI